MNFSYIYQHVFGERAIFVPSKSLPAHLFEEKKATYNQTIKANFEKLWDRNEALRMRFFALLSEVSKTNESARVLKEILFSTSSYEINEDLRHKSSFPDDEAIKNIFIKLNNYYQFVTKDEIETTFQDFLILFKASKLIADFDEKNSDDEDSIAYLHAYKLLVIFGLDKKQKTIEEKGKIQNPFKTIDDFLEKQITTDKKIHDALFQELPINNPPLKDLAGWRVFINTYGYKGLKYFQIAQDIESTLEDKAPQNLEQAEVASRKLSYAREEEYPELAKLCKRYKIGEHIFNRCLEIEKTRKKEDRLPDVMVNGSDKEIGHPGYFLVKLPIDDPRAYILGHITMCCQSIGNEGEKCVIDGLTRKNNGFYVLLKAKGSKSSTPFNEIGKINYQAFDIVGQAYSWLSKGDNLTLDSWENLRPDTDNPIITKMLVAFGKKVTEKYNDIFRVTIGIGGKTPDALKQAVDPHPEAIKEGFQYTDSKEQAVVYAAKDRLEEKIKEIIKKSSHLWENETACQAFFDSLQFTSFKSLTQLDALLANTSIWKEAAINGRKNIDVLMKLVENANFLAIEALYELYQKGLLNTDNLQFMGANIEQLDRVALAVCNLSANNILTDANFKTITSNTEYSDDLSHALITMAKVNILTAENRALLAASSELEFLIHCIKNFDHMNILTDGTFKLLAGDPIQYENYKLALLKLKKANILTDDNCKILATASFDAADVAVNLCFLSENNILTTGDRSLLAANIEFSGSIISGLVTLARSEILTDEYRKLLASNPKYADSLALGIAALVKANLSTIDNIELLTLDAKKARYTSYRLIELSKVALLTADTRKLLATNINYADDITSGLIALSNANILTNENRELLALHPQYSTAIASGLVTLSRENILMDDHRKLLAANPKYAGNLAHGLVELAKADILTDETRKLLTANISESRNLAIVLGGLKKANILSDFNKELVIKNISIVGHIAVGLNNLANAHILTDDHFKFMVENSSGVFNYIPDGLVALSKANLLTDDHRKLLVLNPQYAPAIASLLDNLNKVNILTEENRILLATKVETIRGIYSGVSKLSKANILTDANFKFLIKNDIHPETMADCLVLLSKCNILTDDNLLLISSQNDERIRLVNHCLEKLSTLNLVTDGNFKQLIQKSNVEDIYMLTAALITLMQGLTTYLAQPKPKTGPDLFARKTGEDLLLAAVIKLKDNMSGKNDITYERDEIKALRDGALSETLKQNKDALPQAFLEAEKRLIHFTSK